MHSCTKNLSLLTTFDMINYTKLQKVIIMLHSIIFYCTYSFGKSMTLFLLFNLYNIFKDTKNIIFNLTTVLTPNKNIGKYT